MNKYHVCIICYGDFETRGREVVCSPFCKIKKLLNKEETHWFIKGAETHTKPRVKYKVRFYDARALLYKKENYNEPMINCTVVGCIRPSHQRRISWLKKLVEWFFVGSPAKGK